MAEAARGDELKRYTWLKNEAANVHVALTHGPFVRRLLPKAAPVLWRPGRGSPCLAVFKFTAAPQQPVDRELGGLGRAWPARVGAEFARERGERDGGQCHRAPLPILGQGVQTPPPPPTPPPTPPGPGGDPPCSRTAGKGFSTG